MAANSETGAQLFARLGEKPSLGLLEPRLIPPESEPKPGDVVEIYGSSGCGKTEVLLNFVANCILPQSWNGIHVQGLGTSVVFIDNDHQFSMLRLFSILEKKVAGAVAMRTQQEGERHDRSNETSETAKSKSTHHTYKELYNVPSCGNTVHPADEKFTSHIQFREKELPSDGLNRTYKSNLQEASCSTERNGEESNSCNTQIVIPSDEEVESFLKACLKRLYVIRIATSDQLGITLHSLETLLVNQCDISVLMLDSVSAFHWIDKMKGDGAHNHGANQKLAFTVLSQLIQDYHLVAFATKAALTTRQAHKSNSRCDFADEADYSNPANSSTSASVSNLSTEHHEFMTKEWTKLITHRIILERQDRISPDGPTSLYLSELKHKATGNTKSCHFFIENEGIVRIQ